MTAAPKAGGGVARNISWQAVSVIVRALVSFGALLVLARIAGADVMGLYGLTWAIPALSLAIIQGSAAQGLILVKEVRPGHVAAAYLFTVAIALAAALLIAAVAPLVAGIYHNDALRHSYALAAIFVPPMALGVVDLAITQRNLDFRRVALIQTAAAVLSGATAVAIALTGSPLGGLFALQGVTGLYVFIGFRLVGQPLPAPHVSAADFRELWRHGGHLTLNTLTGNLFTNYVQFVVGLFLPLSEVGIFTLARRIIEVINNQIGGIANQVIFPTAAAGRDNLHSIAELYQIASQLTTAVMMVPLLIIAVAPGEFLTVFAGAHWASGWATLLFLVLMQVGFSLGQNIFSIMQGIGMVSFVWKWNIAMITLQIILISTIGRGSAAAAAAAMALSASVMPVATWFLKRRLGFSMQRWLLNMATVVVPALLIGAVFFSLRAAFGGAMPAILKLALFSGCASLAYVVVLVASNRALRERLRSIIARRRAARGPGT